MDTSPILAAFEQTFQFWVLFCIFVGTLFGIVVGALPGLGSVVAITIILPFTYALGPLAAIALLLGTYCGSVYGGSISAILINTPGTPNSAATCFDGFPMAQQGKADLALGWSTVSSVFGGLFSGVILIIMGPQLARWALHFGPVETFALILMALTCISAVSRGSTLSGLMAGMVGLWVATIGADPLSGDMRFDFGSFQLTGGIGLIPVCVGVFALSEVFSRAAEYKDAAAPTVVYPGMKFPALSEWRKRWWILIKSCLIGTGVGILPGTGASTAAFISYAEAKRSSPRRDQMGYGEPDGIIASESANNAVTGGALIPSLALGLPGDAVTAVMLATLVLHGITPGVRLMADNPVAVYSSFMSLMVSNVAMGLLALFVAKAFAYILKMPEVLMMGFVVILCLLGAYGVRSSHFDIMLTLVFGLVGYGLRVYKVPLAPVVIGVVLGPQLELSLRQGLIVTEGSFSKFFVGHPIAVVLLIVTGCILLLPLTAKLFPSIKKRFAIAEEGT